MSTFDMVDAVSGEVVDSDWGLCELAYVMFAIFF